MYCFYGVNMVGSGFQQISIQVPSQLSFNDISTHLCLSFMSFYQKLGKIPYDTIKLLCYKLL